MRHRDRIVFAAFIAFVALAGRAASAGPDVALRVRAVLEQRCLRCHGRDGVAAKGVFVLDRDRLVATGALVPGDTGSRLLRMVETDAMPLGGPPLSEEEKSVLRAWVAAGAPAWDAPAARAAFAAEPDLLARIARDLDAASPRERPFVRYLSLAHLANAGVDEADLARYRAAVSKLLNSLSWRRAIAPPRPLDASGTILRIDLRDYGWTPETWRRVEALYPYGLDTDAAAGAAAAIARLSGAALPYMRADWFAANASVPPLYHDLLALPETVAELERLLAVDTARDLDDEHGVVRAGVRQSGVSVNSRVLERHETAYGAYWRSYDFRATSRDVFADPLRLSPDGGEFIFTLPNGLQGYFLADARGRRIDAGPLDIVSDRTRPDDPVVRNGRSCMSCHAEGTKPVTDDVRRVVEVAFGGFDREKALALYAPQSVVDAAIAEDRDRFLAALSAAGADRGEAADEPVNALARRYQADLEADEAAAELGLRPAELGERLRQLGAPAGLESLLVPGGGVKRAVWERSFPEIVGRLRLGAPAAVAVTRRMTAPAGRPLASAAATGTDILRLAARVAISTKTQFFTPSQLENELRKRPEFAALGVTIVRDRTAADVEVVVDRPLFTYTYTFAVLDVRTSAVVATGKLTAFDGNFAAPKIAKQLIERLLAARQR